VNYSTDDASRFSVHNTKIKKVVVGDQSLLQKTITCNVRLPFSLENLAHHMSEYQESLVAAGVAMPKVFDVRIENDCLIVLCEDGGLNLIDQYETLERIMSSSENVVANVVAVLHKVIVAGVCIDPHIKNFVGKGEDLLYVDLSPPLTEGYVAARLSVAAGADEHQILQDNFSYFRPEFIPYHFAGDFLDIDPAAEAIFPALHSILSNQGLIDGVDLAPFTSEAKQIRQLENLRLRRGIFMI
jgi:hypothetical protein